MAARIEARKWTGAAEVPVKMPVTLNNAVHLCNVDGNSFHTSPTPPTAVGIARSFWSVVRLNSSTGPDIGTTASNFRLYIVRADSLPANIDILVGRATSYIRTTAALELNIANYPTLLGAPILARTIFNESTALPFTAALASSQVGDFGDFLVFQMAWTAGADFGATREHLPVIEWDEG